MTLSSDQFAPRGLDVMLPTFLLLYNQIKKHREGG